MDKIANENELLQNSIIPKFLNIFNDESKRKKVQKYFSTLLPEKVIDINQEEYAHRKNLSKEEIIKNSLQYSKLDIDREDSEYLIKHFEHILHNPKLRIDTNTNVVIYLEVIQILTYAKQIQSLIDNHPKNYSNHHGTKYRSSSEKNLVKTHLLHLQERLDNPFFKFDDPKIIRITQEQIRIVKLFQTKEYKTLPNALNWVESFIGLDNNILQCTPEELEVIRQVLSLFNGIRTTKEAYIKSFMIFTSVQCNLNTDNNQQNVVYANSMLEIAKYFFNDIFILDAKKKKKTLNFTKNNLKKDWYNKTIINDIPIFAYITRHHTDFFIKYAIVGIADMMKLSSSDIFNDETIEVSTIAPLRNLYRVLKKFNFDKTDTRTLIQLSQATDKQKLLLDSSSILSTK